MKHNLKEMIEDLIATNVLDKSIKTKEYFGPSFTGERCIGILEKRYIECRYPVPDPVKIPILNEKGGGTGGYYHDSSGPSDFAFEVGLEVVKRVEKDFNITIPKEKNLYSIWIDDEDWIRFRSVFFKEDI